MSDPKAVKFNDEELASFRENFNHFDADKSGTITNEEIGEVFKALGEPVPAYKIRDMIAEVDTNHSGTVEFEEFLEMMRKVRVGGGKVTQLYQVTKKVEKMVKLGGTSEVSAEGTTHSFSEDETVAFGDWINYSLADDPDLAYLLPIDTSNMNDLFEKVKDGVLLCKLINSSVKDTIDPRAINMKKLNAFKIGENQTLAVNSASAIGCNTTNLGPEDMSRGTVHLVLGLLWQVIRIGLFAGINLKDCPGLSRLLEGDETLADLLALPPDVLLLRWVNFHLAEAGTAKRVRNFGNDIKDSEAYTYLLHQIAPKDAGVDLDPLKVADPTDRAEGMLGNADKIGCRKFVRAGDVVRGNAKLNLAFVAHLFNTYPGLEPTDEFAGLAEFDLGEMDETREERTFRNWMNSLGCRPFVYNLYNDLQDGQILLQLFDAVQPGIVDWGRVNKPPFKKFGGVQKKLENLNYALDLGRQLKFSIVGIDGKDLYDGIKTLTLAVVWQLMRAYTLSILQRLSGSEKRITDPQIIKWVNGKLEEGEKDSRIRNFKDPSISTALPVLDMVDAIKPDSIDYEEVLAGDTEEDRLSNAKYAISMARKIGANIYALPEDLVEVKPKMVLTVFACLMARALGKEASLC